MSAVSLSPLQRAWARFRRNRLGYWSLWIFVSMLLVSTGAELFSNDKPVVARINGQLLFPILNNPSEKALGGDFVTPTDWKDPFIAELLEKNGSGFNVVESLISQNLIRCSVYRGRKFYMRNFQAGQ